MTTEKPATQGRSNQATAELTDEQLLEKFWHLEANPEQRAQHDALIESDAATRARWNALRAELALLKPNSPDSAPPETVRRLQHALLAHAASSDAKSVRMDASPTRSRSNNPWLLIASFAAGVAAVMLWTRTTMPPEHASPPVLVQASDRTPSTGGATTTVSLQSVRAHFAETQELLHNLDGDDVEQEQLLRDMIAQNQIFLRRAQEGQPEVARVLAALQPVLIELSKTEPSGNREALIEQFEFESQALLTKLQARSSNAVPKSI